MTTLRPLYNGQTNSPEILTVGVITDEATSITISDASLLPAAPFPLTIGYESVYSETVLVTAVAGNVLTVSRGWDGEATSWQDGTKCARAFTARDLNDLQYNQSQLNAGKEEKLSTAETASTLADTDTVVEVSASVTKRISWGTIKALLTSLFNGLYAPKDYVPASLAQDGYTANLPTLTGNVTLATTGDIPSVPGASTAAPLMDGTAAAGSSAAFARGDHRHPTDTSRASETDLTNHTSNEDNPHKVTLAQIGAAPASHNQAASTITAGTFAGQVKANATAVQSLSVGQVRNITISTTDLTAGSSTLAYGDLYFVYEV